MQKSLMELQFLRRFDVLCYRIIETWQENYVLGLQTNLCKIGIQYVKLQENYSIIQILLHPMTEAVKF